MAELKTKLTSESVDEFLNKVEPEQKRLDSFEVKKLMEKITGQKPRMWGASIVGFDMYHYKSTRSSQEGDWPMIGFSPRKQSLTLYVLCYSENNDELLKKLGKHKRSVSCLYLNRLSDIDMNVLTKIIENTYRYMKEKYPKI